MAHETATIDPKTMRNLLDVSFQAKANYVYGGKSHRDLLESLISKCRGTGMRALEAELYEQIIQGVADTEPDMGLVEFSFQMDRDLPMDAIGRLSGETGFGPVRVDLSKHGPACAIETDPDQLGYWNHTVLRAKDGRLTYQALAHGSPGSKALQDETALDDVVHTMDELGDRAAKLIQERQAERAAEHGPDREKSEDGPQFD